MLIDRGPRRSPPLYVPDTFGCSARRPSPGGLPGGRRGVPAADRRVRERCHAGQLPALRRRRRAAADQGWAVGPRPRPCGRLSSSTNRAHRRSSSLAVRRRVALDGQPSHYGPGRVAQPASAWPLIEPSSPATSSCDGSRTTTSGSASRAGSGRGARSSPRRSGRAALLEQRRRPGPFHVGVLLENVPEYVFLLGGRRARRARRSSASTRPAAARSSPATSATPTASSSSPTPSRRTVARRPRPRCRRRPRPVIDGSPD